MYSLDTFDHAGMTVRIVQDDDAYDMDPHKSFGDPVGKWYSWADGRDRPGSADETINPEYYWHTNDPNVAILADLRRDPHANTGSDEDGEGYGYALVVPLRYSDYGSSRSAIEVGCDEDRANGAYVFTAAELAEWKASNYRPLGMSNSDWTAAKQRNRERTVRKATEYVTAHLAEWVDWANGNVWGIVVTDEDGDELDSCWGFIGDPYPEDGYIRSEARRMAEGAAEQAARERVNRADAEYRDIVTVPA